MYLLVIRKRDGIYHGSTKKTTWGKWRPWGTEVFQTKKDLNERLTGKYRYAGDEYEQFEVKYYEVDPKTCVTVQTKVIIEEVK